MEGVTPAKVSIYIQTLLIKNKVSINNNNISQSVSQAQIMVFNGMKLFLEIRKYCSLLNGNIPSLFLHKYLSTCIKQSNIYIYYIYDKFPHIHTTQTSCQGFI